jgi:hypothetical protein
MEKRENIREREYKERTRVERRECGKIAAEPSQKTGAGGFDSRDGGGGGCGGTVRIASGRSTQMGKSRGWGRTKRGGKRL